MTTSKYGEDYFAINNNFATPGGAVGGTATDLIIIPVKCKIVDVYACSINITSVGGTGVDPLVDIKLAATSILDAPISLDVDATVYRGSITTPATVYARGSSLNVCYTTDASGDMVRPQVVLVCQSQD